MTLILMKKASVVPLNGDDAMHLSNDDFVPAHNFRNSLWYKKMHLFFQYKNSQLPLKLNNRTGQWCSNPKLLTIQKNSAKAFKLLFPSTLRNSKSLTRNYDNCFQQTARRSIQKLESSISKTTMSSLPQIWQNPVGRTM